MLVYECLFFLMGSAGATSQFAPLQDFATRNTESLGRLFLEFLWQFAFDIDPRTTIVAINTIDDVVEPGKASPLSRRPFTKSRVRKSALSQWRMGSVLAIEDPFERDYDVAHVLRAQVMHLLQTIFSFVLCVYILRHVVGVAHIEAGARPRLRNSHRRGLLGTVSCSCCCCS